MRSGCLVRQSNWLFFNCLFEPSALSGLPRLYLIHNLHFRFKMLLLEKGLFFCLVCCRWSHIFHFSPLSAEEEETSSKTAGHMTGRPHSRQWNTDLLCMWHDGVARLTDSMFMFPSQICVAMKQTTLLLSSSTRSRSLSRWGCYFRWCQWCFIVLQHNEAGDNHTALCSAILWCHVFAQDN